MHARAEILNGLLQRLQKLFRTFSPGPADAQALTLAEKRLLEIKDIFSRRDLHHACQINPLLQLIRSALTRLEDAPSPEKAATNGMIPVQALGMTEEAAGAGRLVYVIRKEPDVEVRVAADVPAPPKRWPSFVAGMATALVLSAAAVFGWQALHRPDEATQALAASVARLPEPVTPAQIAALRGTGVNSPDSGIWIARMTRRVNWVTTLTPGWRLRYGQGLVSQAQALWPDDPATGALVQRWEQYQAARTLPPGELNGWHDGMMQLRALSARLDAMDRQKGKYLTGSELKTLVWRITSAFARTVPVEEQLRQLASGPGEAAAPRTNIEQTARHLDSLIHLLEQLSVQKADALPDKPAAAGSDDRSAYEGF